MMMNGIRTWGEAVREERNEEKLEEKRKERKKEKRKERKEHARKEVRGIFLQEVIKLNKVEIEV